MAFKLSPSVEVTEKDLTLGVPAVATSIGAFAGPFVWGPVEEITTVASESEMVAKFGKPNNDVAAHWFSAANFLAYANNLKTVRVVGATAKNAVDPDAPAAVLIKNANDWEATEGNRDYAVAAKYAGSLGNSIGFELCGEGGFEYWQFKGAFDSAPSDAAFEVHGVVYDIDGSWTGTPGSILEKYAYSSTVAGTLAADGSNIYIVDQLNRNSKYVWIGDNFLTDAYVQILTNPYTENNELGPIVQFGTVSPSDYILTNTAQVTGRTEQFTAAGGETSIDTYTTALQLSGATVAVSLNSVALTDGVEYTLTGNTIDFTTGSSPNGALVATDDVDIVITDLTITAVVDTANNTGGFVSGYNKTTQQVDFTTVLSGVAQTVSVAALVNSNVSVNASNVYDVELVGGVDDNTGVDLTDGYYLFQDPETVDISLVVTGPATTTQAEWILDNIGETRKDVVVFLSPLREDVVGINDPSTILNNLTNPTTGYMQNFNSSSYGFMDANWKYQYDRYNDVYRWVPCNGDVAGLAARTDNTNDPWWAFAGFNRGQIKNVVKLAWNPNKTYRDELFKNRMNAICTFPGDGTILFGDKTMLTRPSAFDAVNVRRLFIVLEKAIATAAKYLLFEFNDEFTQAQFRNLVEPFLRDVRGRRGIEAFKIVCDSTNNTGEVKQRREFVGDIYIKPNYAIRYIQLNFIAVRSDVSFSEVGA